MDLSTPQCFSGVSTKSIQESRTFAGQIRKEIQDHMNQKGKSLAINIPISEPETSLKRLEAKSPKVPKFGPTFVASFFLKPGHIGIMPVTATTIGVRTKKTCNQCKSINRIPQVLQWICHICDWMIYMLCMMYLYTYLQRSHPLSYPTKGPCFRESPGLP